MDRGGAHEAMALLRSYWGLMVVVSLWYSICMYIEYMNKILKENIRIKCCIVAFVRFIKYQEFVTNF